ncbi:MAG: tyrosine-type recombinase/integrase [Methyloceanibacter sp.]
MARKTLTEKGVAALKARSKLYAHPDPQLPGHYVRVTPAGSKSFVAVARDPRGKQVWITIGSAAHIGIAEARERAREAVLRIKAGEDRAGPQSFQSVTEEWLKRHVDAKGLRDAYEMRRVLTKHVSPEWAGRDFESIRRGDVAKLLDKVEDESGARTSDKALSVISGICHWYEKRHEDYVSPIIRGMKRYSSKEHARSRILSDEEIRAVWSLAPSIGLPSSYLDIVKLALLTAQRREKVATMQWEDVSVDGTWSIPTTAREKNNAGALMLPDAAVEIIKRQPRFASNPYVFAGRDGSHTRNFHGPRDALREALGKGTDWTLHDLRRTARSLMSRAGVRPDIAERVLGHTIRGVEGIYDQLSYREEKAHALRALAGVIENILRPPGEKVVGLRQ